MARRNANYLEGVVATYEELKAQIDALTQEAEAAREREISAIVSEIRQTVRTYQIRPEQIFPQGARRRPPATRREPAPAKYRNPVTGQTWNGRGRTPKWLCDVRRDEFLVDGLS
nr:H-NS histone family protein [Burkholderia vietnamiensis]